MRKTQNPCNCYLGLMWQLFSDYWSPTSYHIVKKEVSSLLCAPLTSHSFIHLLHFIHSLRLQASANTSHKQLRSSDEAAGRVGVSVQGCPLVRLLNFKTNCLTSYRPVLLSVGSADNKVRLVLLCTLSVLMANKAQFDDLLSAFKY